MTKSELIKALNEKLPAMQSDDVESAVNCLLQNMADALVQGERIEVRGFGSFDLRHQAARVARNRGLRCSGTENRVSALTHSFFCKSPFY